MYLKLICLKLEISIEKYSNLGKVYITGDFNSRTASSEDYVEFDKYILMKICQYWIHAAFQNVLTKIVCLTLMDYAL